MSESSVEMLLRSLYSFKKTHPTSLNFAQGDLFIELPGNMMHEFYIEI